MSMMSLKNVTFGYDRDDTILHDVSLTLTEGKSLGIVGESGSGKSTILRLMLGLASPGAGEVTADGTALNIRSRSRMQAHRRFAQPVFQDPYTSLDPRQRVGAILAEPHRALGLPGDAEEAAIRVLKSVDLPDDSLRRYPRAFSGGQRQRIAIARALIARPRVLLADEPVSALDLSTRVRIVDLLRDVARDTTMVIVSHDLAIIAALCTDMIVLERGRVVESGPVRQILDAPAHPYTQSLLAAVPRLPAI